MRSNFDIRGLNLYSLKKATAFAKGGSLKAAQELQDILGPDGGPRTGRTYKRGDKTHTASAPGESPAVDRGRLRQSATHHPVRIEGEKVIGSAGVATDYALPLEIGTENMGPRPSVSRLNEEARQDRIFDYAAAAMNRA